MEETKLEHKENKEEIIRILESVIILLEDNPKIKDVSGFYLGADFVGEVDWVRNYLKEML